MSTETKAIYKVFYFIETNHYLNDIRNLWQYLYKYRNKIPEEIISECTWFYNNKKR